MVSDEALLRQVHAGDEDAMAALVRRYHARLHGFIFRYTQDLQLTQDLVQETFLRVIRARDSEPQSFAPWLFRVALNLCRDQAKSAYQRREQPAAMEEMDWHATDADSDPAVIAEQAEVRAAVAALPPGQREVLLLHYFEGWTLQEVASALGTPLGTVKSRLFSGLKRLKSSIGGPTARGGVNDGQTQPATFG
ncbi:MAG: RNA polymerase sigma factor [Chloroflexota bacterium]